MKTICLLRAVLLFGLMAASSAWAGDIRISASVDKHELTLEDSVLLSIRVEGVRSGPQPKLPEIQEFQVRSRGTSSAIQIINGKKTSSFTHNVSLSPKETGTFTIGSASVEIDGATYRTEPITLVVRPVSEAVDTTREVFAELTVSKTQPFVQEQITATLRIYHRVEIKNLGLSFPFPGFREEKLGTPQQYIRVLKGIRYGVYEIHTALFPLRAGKIDIPAGRVELDQVDRSRQRGFFDPFDRNSPFDPFAALEHKTLRTPPIHLEVQALPTANRPAGFTNLVGEFFITSELSRSTLEVGDTATLTVTMTGQGNIMDMPLPVLNAEKDFKVYEDQPEYHQIPGARLISGEKKFSYALVPQQAGELNVPRVSLSYFNPIKGQYVTLQSPPLTLRATPASGNSQPKVVDTEKNPGGPTDPIKKLAEDILPIHTGPELYNHHTLSGDLAWVSGLGMVLPAVLFLLYRHSYQRRHRLKHDIAFSRNHRAFKQAVQQLNSLAKSGAQQNLARELSLIVREYLGNILNLQGTAITSREVENKLRGGRFDEADIDSTQKLLEKFESLQYASIPDPHPEELIRESRILLEQLEKKS